MDDDARPNQTGNITGNGNTVIFIGRDMYPPSPPTAVPTNTSRRTRRWLGAYATLLTVVSTAALGISMIPPPADPEPRTFTAPAQIAVTPRLSPPARIAVAAPVSSSARIGIKAPPKTIQWPTQASALCRDRTFSSSQRRSGTCSWHGGVAHWRFDADHPHWRRG